MASQLSLQPLLCSLDRYGIDAASALDALNDTRHVHKELCGERVPMFLVFQHHRIEVLADDVHVELPHGGHLRPQKRVPIRADLAHQVC